MAKPERFGSQAYEEREENEARISSHPLHTIYQQWI
jgi:hypothetical protein